jgi:hypothetical protein
MIDAYGFDLARIILALILILFLAADYAILALTSGLTILESSVALSVYILSGQALFGGEWIFGGVETKVFAYALVLSALTAGIRGWYWTALLLMALATWFHFLVGGFWAIALLFFFYLSGVPLRNIVRYLMAWVLPTTPLFLFIVYERQHHPADINGLNVSLDWVYSVFRNPHHIVPFFSKHNFIHHWLSGFLITVIAICLFFFFSKKENGKTRLFLLWACFLNAYLVLAFGLALLDHKTYMLGALYIFRPESLILLISILCGILLLRRAKGVIVHRLIVAGGAAILCLVSVKTILECNVFFKSPHARLVDQLSQADQLIIAKIRETTLPDSVILIEPLGHGTYSDGDLPRVAMERLLERPTLVNWKFIPTLPDEQARWYKLWMLRKNIFAGNCHLIKEIPINYLLIETPASPVLSCGKVVWRENGFTLLAVTAEK